MKIFDSHCHLDDKAYRKDIARVIERAHQKGVMSRNYRHPDPQGPGGQLAANGYTDTLRSPLGRNRRPLSDPGP